MNAVRFLLLIFACLWLSGGAIAQSSRSGMGAVPYADANGTGVTFRTWAPNATTVGVKGTFNGWGSTVLAKDASGGTWSVDISRAKAGDEYKFVVNGAFKKDPRGKRVVNSAGNSIVYDPGKFDWGSAGSYVPYHNDLVIYEMHVGSYNAEDWLPSTFDKCGEKIAYLKALGISAVELMPINEFPGDRSWGYNPSDPYAIESSFGGPDGFKRFVKACHENGIAVLVDVVHNHYGPSDLEMWQYDGWSQNGLGGIYFYNDAAKANTDWGQTRPDFGRPEVRDYIKGQIRMFLEDYKVDGFRWDSVFNILYYNNGGSENDSGRQMLAEINDMMAADFPNALRIAEDHAFDQPVNFQAQWDHGYLNDIRWLATGGSDSDRNMSTLAFHLGNGRFNRVVYVESHDTCGDLNNKHRLSYDIDNGSPQGYWSKKRALLANATVLVSPGIPMLFEGSEMHEDWTFSNNTALRWALTNQNAGIVSAYADLIHLRRNAYGNSAGLKQPEKVDVHHVDNTAKIVGLVRWDQGGKTDDLVVAINWSATPRNGYDMPFPSAGTWYCLYNSDSKSYDSSFGGIGPDVGGSVVAGANASLNLGAYSMQIYSKTPIPTDSAATFDPPNPNGCQSVVTITYAPGDGPLTNAATVSAYIGRNNWQNPSNYPMTLSGGVWTLAYTIPDLTYELNLTFTDGAAAWDNNGGLNWSVPVSNCGDLPSEAVWSPHVPQGCIPLQVTYHPNGGPLMGASNILLHIGRNNWKAEVQSLPMTAQGDNEWTTTYSIPDDTWQVDFVFNGQVSTNPVWDNNNGADWHVRVQGCLAEDQPYVTLSHPPPVTNVATAVTNMALQGTAHLLQGHLRWTNRLNGAFGTISYATNWSIASVPLAEGINVIRVSGTNSAVNPNDGAWDSPTNSAYAASWLNGSNGGGQFKPWALIVGSGTASLAISNAECNLGPIAWALQSDNQGLVQAIRPFAAALQPGDKISFVFENGGVDGTPSSVGVAFHNRFEQRLAEVYFEGGTTNFVVNDTAVHNTGISWSPDPKICTFEMLSTLDYRLTFNGQAFTGEFANASEYAISYIRFWNNNAGGGNERKLYIGDLAVTGQPLPVFTYSAETAVTRALSPYRTTESLISTGTNLVATLNSVVGLANNVWSATVLTNGGWNWTPLPTNEYAIVPSNNTLTLAPSDTEHFKIYSIGKPGGF